MDWSFTSFHTLWRRFAGAKAVSSMGLTHAVLRPSVQLELLEDRILFDASPLGELLRADPGSGSNSGEFLDTSQSAWDFPTPSLAVELEEQDSDVPLETLDQLLKSLATLDAVSPTHPLDSAPDAAPHSLLIVDGSIADWELLLTDLKQTHSDAEILILSSQADGVDQISDWLSGYSQVSEIHLFAHANSGQLQLGSTYLSVANFQDYAASWANWNQILADGTDLLIYGCDLADSESGQLLLEELARWTNLDLAASTNLTGSAELGGDWILEYQLGSVTATSLFQDVSNLELAWSGILNLPVAPESSNDQETSANGRGNDRAVAMHSDGTYVVVWSENLGGGLTGWDVFARRFAADGTALTSSFRVNQHIHTDDDQRFAAIDMDAAGNFVVTWTSENQDGNDDGVFARRFAADGTALSSEFQVNSVSVGKQHNSKLAVADDGSFVVVWEGNGSGDTYGIFGQRFGSSGAFISGNFRVNTSTSGSQFDASISINASGNFAVSWDDSNGYYYQRFDSGGNKFGGPVEVSGSSSAGNGSILLNNDNSLVAAWHSTILDLTQAYVKVYDSGDSLVRLNLINDITLTDDHTNPSLSGTGAGNFIVTWEAESDKDIFARRFNADGTHASSVFRVNQEISGDQLMSSVSAISDYDFVVVWTDAGNGSQDQGVYARVYGDAPVLDTGRSPVLNSVDEGATHPNGTLIADLLPMGSVSQTLGPRDFGMAIVGLNANFGTWQFSLDGGTHWNNIDVQSLNSQVEELALHLGPTARIRLLPYGDLQGTISDAITFRAWNTLGATEGEYSVLTSPGSGISPYSAETDTAGITIVSVNDAPNYLSGGGSAVNLLGNSAIASAIAQQPDGKTIVVGRFDNGTDFDVFVTRYDAHGNLDLSFGTGGSVTFGIGTTNDWANAVAVQADGKIVIAGQANIGGFTHQVVVRLNSDGTSDSSFGTSGAFTQAIGSVAHEVFDLKLLTDGKILIAGSTVDGYRKFTLTQLSSAGTLDHSFGTNGVVLTDLGSAGYAKKLELQSDGKILVGGYQTTAGLNQLVVARYLADGSLDPSYGTGGLSKPNLSPLSNELNAMQLLADGRLLVGGTIHNGINNDWMVIRLDANGVVDPNFQGIGFRIIDLGSDDKLGDLLLASTGKITLVGQSTAGPNQEIVNLRLNFDGSDDLSYGILGKQVFNFGSFNLGNDALLQTDGKILVAGTANPNSDLESLLFRIHSDGELDGQFAGSESLGGTISFQENGTAVVLDSNAEIFDVELVAAGSFDGSRLTVSRVGGANTHDRFYGSGTLSHFVQGQNLTISGTVIGTVTTNSLGTLVLTFNHDATHALVNQTLQQIAYRNSVLTAGNSVDIAFHFDDQNSGAQGTGGAGSVSATVTVNVVNDNNAPQLVSNLGSFSGIHEDQLNSSGNSVIEILASAGNPISDIDAGAVQGIALVGLSSGNGSWQFSIDGGSSWSNIGTVTNSEALLLRELDRIRFLPNGENGTSANITFRAWDQTGVTLDQQGNKVDTANHGGHSSFSSQTASASITVSDLNDAPVLDNTGSMVLTDIFENDLDSAGNSVASMIGSAGGNRITDVDTGAMEGIAITAHSTGSGTWQYSIDHGVSWNAIGLVSNSNALLLRAVDSLRFVPNGLGNSADLTLRAWDQSGSTFGQQGTYHDASSKGGITAFSSATETVSIAIHPVNDAPVLSAGTFQFDSIDEDQTNPLGNSVSSLIASAGGNPITDIDAGALEGIAVIGSTSGNGRWQFSINAGTSWHDLNSVSATEALLLRDIDRLRFVPNGETGTSANITFRAWDQTGSTTGQQGNKVDATSHGGSTSFSATTANASILVTHVNDAPVLDNSGTMQLTSIDEDQIHSSGDSVAAIIGSAGGDRITDVDAGALEGIAITSLDSGTGTWQFSIDNGASWNSIGGVSNSHSLLLRAEDLVRLVPDSENGGSAAFSFRAWDQTGGTSGLQGTKVDTRDRGGTNPYSSQSEVATIFVANRNDAPELSLQVGDSHQIFFTENNSGLLGSGTLTVADIDAGDQVFAQVAAVTARGTTQGLTTSPTSLLAMLTIPNRVLQTFETSARFQWQFHSGGEAFDYLADGEILELDYIVIVEDIQGAQASATITVSIVGTNDAPQVVIGPSDHHQVTLIETNAALSTSGSLTIIDVDYDLAVTGTVDSVTIIGNQQGLQSNLQQLQAMLNLTSLEFGQNANSGSLHWSFNSGAEFFDFLPAGASLQLVYQIGVSDSVDTRSTSITIEIVGANDAPWMQPNTTISVSELIGVNSSELGYQISSLPNLSSAIGDADRGASWGLAVTAPSQSSGSWQYRMAGSTQWIHLPASDLDSALLLRFNDYLRYLPLDEQPVTADLKFRVWDLTSGTPGSQGPVAALANSAALSSEIGTFSLARLAAVALPNGSSNPSPPAGSNSNSPNSFAQTPASDSNEEQAEKEVLNEVGLPALHFNAGETLAETQPVAGHKSGFQATPDLKAAEAAHSLKMSDETYESRKSDNYYTLNVKANETKLDLFDTYVSTQVNPISFDDDLIWTRFFEGLNQSSPDLLINQYQIGVPTFAASTASLLTVGYLAWVIRGGVLLTTFMSSLPTWKALDILPLIESSGQDSETIEQIVDTQVNA